MPATRCAVWALHPGPMDSCSSFAAFSTSTSPEESAEPSAPVSRIHRNLKARYASGASLQVCDTQRKPRLSRRVKLPPLPLPRRLGRCFGRRRPAVHRPSDVEVNVVTGDGRPGPWRQPLDRGNVVADRPGPIDPQPAWPVLHAAEDAGGGHNGGRGNAKLPGAR